jgi:hypothetical protein
MAYPPLKPKPALSVTPIVNVDRPVRHLNQTELSRRWCISPRTLERWRWLKFGPTFLKVGGRVVYKLEDIEQYESAQRHVIANKGGRS